MVGETGESTGRGYFLFGHTDKLSNPERIVLFVFVGAAASFDVFGMIRDPGDNMPYPLLSVLTTLTLALFAFSPAMATFVMGVVVASAFVLGIPGYALMGASIAALLVTRLASTPLLLAFFAGVTASTIALIARSDVPIGDVGAFLAVVLVAGTVGMGLRIALDRGNRLETSLAEQAEHERLAIQAERSWIAGELHDSIAHHLTIISLHSQMLDDEQMRPLSQNAIEEAARKALADLRFIINISEASESSEDTSVGDLEEALRDAEKELKSAGHPTVIKGDPRDRAIPRGVEIILSRMIRESTTNIVKYSGPGRVEFDLDVKENSIGLDVKNPISSGSPRVISSSGTGISRMSERVLAQRGEFRAGRIGDDWVVHARLPIAATNRTTTNFSTPESEV